jgi:hypothetical protein
MMPASSCSLLKDETINSDGLSTICTVCMHRVLAAIIVEIVWLQECCACSPALHHDTNRIDQIDYLDSVDMWVEVDCYPNAVLSLHPFQNVVQLLEA